MSDTLPTATRVSDPGIRALYRLENRWQAWIDVEVALAYAQEELGIIPHGAADAIAKVGKLDLMDRARLDEGFARTGHTLVPLVWELARLVGEPHGGWVHWGATTQNITQTGDLLVLRQAHAIFLRQIGEALLAMADLAERTADMPMPGRTHGQHAVPATFGYKVAVWIDELCRHVERFQQAAPRLFISMLGGGAGTFASLGEQGPRTQAGIGRHRFLHLPELGFHQRVDFPSDLAAGRGQHAQHADVLGQVVAVSLKKKSCTAGPTSPRDANVHAPPPSIATKTRGSALRRRSICPSI